MRTFISIELTDDIKKNIENLIDEFKANLTPIKWVVSKDLHVTLKFLGWVADDKVEEVCSITASTVKDTGPFNVSFGGIGAFPTVKSPRLLWVGITDGAGTLAGIADSLEEEFGKKGYRMEEKDFSPHITIARVKENIDTETLAKHLNARAEAAFGGLRVDHISVMKSTLTPKGPIYGEYKRVSLK